MYLKSLFILAFSCVIMAVNNTLNNTLNHTTLNDPVQILQSNPLASISKLNPNLVGSENYHPNTCTIDQYVFAFVWNGTHQLVHGLWPDICDECTTCGYPTCCGVNSDYKYIQPSNTTFIENYWLNGLTPSKISTCGMTSTTLFQHEVIKHGSCMSYSDTDTDTNNNTDTDSEKYLSTVENLYWKMEKTIIETCGSTSECEIKLSNIS